MFFFLKSAPPPYEVIKVCRCISLISCYGVFAFFEKGCSGKRNSLRHLLKYVIKLCKTNQVLRADLSMGTDLYSNHPVPVFESMPITSLPDGAVRVAAPTYRCAVCASRDCHQADYELKYVYPRGVFHANCYAELSLFDLPYNENSGCVEALLGSEAGARAESAEVWPLQREVGAWTDDDNLCDAHLAVWLG